MPGITHNVAQPSTKGPYPPTRRCGSVFTGKSEWSSSTRNERKLVLQCVVGTSSEARTLAQRLVADRAAEERVSCALDRADLDSWPVARCVCVWFVFFFQLYAKVMPLNTRCLCLRI